MKRSSKRKKRSWVGRMMKGRGEDEEQEKVERGGGGVIG